MLRSMLMIGVMPLPLRAICDNAQGAAAHACAPVGPNLDTLCVRGDQTPFLDESSFREPLELARQPGDQQAAGAVVAKVRSDLVLAVPTGRDGTACS